MACITNRATFLAHSTHVGSSMISATISLVNPSIDAYFVLMSTACVSYALVVPSMSGILPWGVSVCVFTIVP